MNIEMLGIKNLNVEIDGKKILKDFNLTLKKGKVYALMGPNGSGKSTLANVLMGNPLYRVTSGEILLDGENLLNLKVDERARKGLFLSFQYPVSISGVTIINFLRQAYSSIRREKIPMFKFRKLVEEKSKILNLSSELLKRYLNEGFSGGEKKKAEILQMLVLDPKVAILDETDSGLDIDALRTVSSGVNSFLNKDKIVLIITHYKRILNHINPDKVFVMRDGKIILKGEPSIIDSLEEKGYSWIED